MKILLLSKNNDILFRDSMLALTMQTAIDYPYTSLMLSTCGNNINFEKCFVRENQFVRETQMYRKQDALKYLVDKEKAGSLLQDDIDHVFVPVVDKHLYYLPEAESRDNKKDISDEELAKLMDKLDLYADIVYINAMNEERVLKSQMVEMADILIFGINANLSNCDEILLLPAGIREKSLFMLSEYEACSCNNITKLTKYYRIDESHILTIPTNAAFSQASIKGKGEEYIKKSNLYSMTTRSKIFMSQLKRSANIMVESLDF